MSTIKRLGIWMDHATANLIELTPEESETKTIESKSTIEAKEHGLSRSENVMHNKEQHELTAYYKQVSEAIKNYQEVLLFGPTTAKEELANLLKADHHFDKVKVTVKHADKMSYNQQHAFVKKHFFNAL